LRRALSTVEYEEMKRKTFTVILVDARGARANILISAFTQLRKLLKTFHEKHA
jgi:hypothetical protein